MAAAGRSTPVPHSHRAQRHHMEARPTAVGGANPAQARADLASPRPDLSSPRMELVVGGLLVVARGRSSTTAAPAWRFRRLGGQI